MRDFFDWLFNTYQPGWVIVVVVFLGLIFLGTLMFMVIEYPGWWLLLVPGSMIWLIWNEYQKQAVLDKIDQLLGGKDE